MYRFDNDERRQQVIKVCSKLSTLMESTFKTTNNLIATIENHIHGSHFLKIAVDENASIEKNCDIIINRMNEIQLFLEVKKEKLKEIIESTLYKNLMQDKEPIAAKIALAKTITPQTFSICGTETEVVLIAVLTRGRILEKAITSVGKIKNCGLASIAFGVLEKDVDMIANAISGAVENSDFEEVIADLQAVLQQCEPDSDKYNFCIMETTVEINQANKV